MLFVTVSLLDWFMKISSTLAVCTTFAVLFPYAVFSVMTAPFVRNRLDAGATVAVDGVIFDKDFAHEAGIGVQDDTLAVGDRAGAIRRNQLGVTEDAVAAYDVMDARLGIRVHRLQRC